MLFAFAYIILRKITNIDCLLIFLVKASILNCIFVIPLKLKNAFNRLLIQTMYFFLEEEEKKGRKWRNTREKAKSCY
jgi:hypothetical protein